MQTVDSDQRHAADLHWLAFLLTGRREISVDLAMEAVSSEEGETASFSNWMRAWSRRVVISKALTAVRDELAASVRRLDPRNKKKAAIPEGDWTLAPDTTKAELERALLAIELFPRNALLLSIFEKVSVEDTAVLLDASPELVREARTEGLRQLTSNLARMQGWVAKTAGFHALPGEAQYA